MGTETQEPVNDAKKRILNLLARGKVSVEEAEQLLDAIQGAQRKAAEQMPQESKRLQAPQACQSQAEDEDEDAARDAMAAEEEARVEAEDAATEAAAEAEEAAREAEEEAAEAVAEAEEAAREAAAEAQEAAREAAEAAREAEEEAEEARSEWERAKQHYEQGKRKGDSERPEWESGKQQSGPESSRTGESRSAGGPHSFAGGPEGPRVDFANIGKYVRETVQAAMANLPQGMSDFVGSRVRNAFDNLESRRSIQATGWQREFRAAEVMKVDVSADNGPIIIRRSDDADKIKVRVVLDPMKAMMTGETEAQSRLEGGVLFLTANRRTEGFEIELPAGKPISAFAKNGPLVAEGLEGEMKLATKNGPLTAKHCKGIVGLEAKNGPISAENVGDNVQVLGKNGPIRVQTSGGYLRAETKNGPLAVSDHSGDLSALNCNGPITISGSIEKIKVETTNAPVRIDVSSSARISGSISSVNGPVTLSLGEQCAVRLNCETSRGPIIRKRQLDIEEESRHLLRACRGKAEGNLAVTNGNGAIVIE